jgi:glycosyltransferase involved in cell wall biosynthesis
MRIAITNPTTWPRARRGAERFLNELAFYMAGRGHDVTVISTQPGPREVRHERGYTTICHRRLWHPIMARAGIHEFHPFMLTTLGHLLQTRYDIVHCCTFMDAIAARMARRLTRVPYVFWINGLPPRVRYVRSMTARGAVFRRAVLGADEVISLSRYMWEYFQDRFGRGGVVLPVPVDVDRFRLSEHRDHERPIILCAAALDDARKGGRLLMRAFNEIRQTRPTAVLQVSCLMKEETKNELMQFVAPPHRTDVQFLGAGQIDDLPGLFGRAAVSVLPSHWEAFGMVILESMATGTPVVGTQDGAIPELIANRGVGGVFETDPSVTEPTNLDGLVQTLLDTLDLSRDPRTALRCRAHAEQYSWARVGPRFEELYHRVIGQRKATRHREATSCASS